MTSAVLEVFCYQIMPGIKKHVKCVNKEKIGWIASPAKKEKVYEKENIYQKVVCF